MELIIPGATTLILLRGPVRQQAVSIHPKNITVNPLPQLPSQYLLLSRNSMCRNKPTVTVPVQPYSWTGGVTNGIPSLNSYYYISVTVQMQTVALICKYSQ